MDTTNQNDAVSSLTVAFPVALIVLLMVVMLYNFKESIDYFDIVFWAVILIVPYMIAVGVHFMTQQINCRKLDSGAAFKGGVATIVAMVAGMGISSLSWFRIPVVSVFAPLILPDPTTEVTVLPSLTKNTGATQRGGAGSACCSPTRRLTDVETEYPILVGLSRAFYLFFASMFGIVIGTNLSATC